MQISVRLSYPVSGAKVLFLPFIFQADGILQSHTVPVISTETF